MHKSCGEQSERAGSGAVIAPLEFTLHPQLIRDTLEIGDLQVDMADTGLGMDRHCGTYMRKCRSLGWQTRPGHRVFRTGRVRLRPTAAHRLPSALFAIPLQDYDGSRSLLLLRQRRLKGCDPRLKRRVLFAGLLRHGAGGVEFFAGDEIAVGHPAVDPAFHRGLGLGLGTLGDTHRIGHELAHVVEELVRGLHGHLHLAGPYMAPARPQGKARRKGRG